MTNYHRVSADDFAALASGFGGAGAVRELGRARLSKHLLLLKYVCETWPSWRAECDMAIAVLAEAQARRPDVVADLIGDPLVGGWAATATRRLRGSGPIVDAPLEADVGHLGALAAAAALRAGVDAEVVAYVRDGVVTLPGLGDAVLGGVTDGRVSVVVSGARATLSRGTTSVTVPEGGTAWRAMRWLTARYRDVGCRIGIEESNPYRDCYHAAAAERMSDGEAQAWQATGAEAWELLCRFLPERAAELAEGLRSVVPLVDDGAGARSGTARDAFGTLGLTRPRSAPDMLITLVHEFQHSKLSGLLDLCPLYEPGGPERHFAPWRLDPRPTGGLIQGVYAFLGVADAWCRLRRSPPLRELAEREFAEVREQVQAGLTALEASTELTPTGRRFVAGVRSAFEGLLAEPLAPAVARDARAVLEKRRSDWRARNRRLLAEHRVQLLASDRADRGA